MKHLLLTLLAASSALAGPPLICHRIDIGNAKSLPWHESENWNGADSHYDTARLAADTLALLSPSAPLNVRMETLRRAAIYSSGKHGLRDQITAQLLTRVATSEAAGKPDAMAWFDAGVWVEAERQTAFLDEYERLSSSERAHWRWSGAPAIPDGVSWVHRATRLGAKGIDPAIERMLDFQPRPEGTK